MWKLGALKLDVVQNSRIELKTEIRRGHVFQNRLEEGEGFINVLFIETRIHFSASALLLQGLSRSVCVV